jgi:hypothetical protein
MVDRSTFEHHLAEMRTNFERTKAPALVAQCERLAQQASVLDHPSGATLAGPNRFAILNADSRGVYELLSDFNDPRECGQRALELVIKEAKARAGYLYLLRSNGIELVAATREGEPPASIRESLGQLVERAYRHERGGQAIPLDLPRTQLTEASLSGHAPTKFETAHARGGLTEQHTGEYRLVLLSTRSTGSLVVIGGIVLELLQSSRLGLSSEYLDAIASVLHDASDVTSLVDESDSA